MKTARRQADRNSAQKAWFRSERVYGSGTHWYFQTREGVDIGPYDSRFEAEIEAGMLRELMLDVEPAASMKVIREFVLDSFAMGRPLMPHFREAPLKTG